MDDRQTSQTVRFNGSGRIAGIVHPPPEEVPERESAAEVIPLVRKEEERDA